MTVHAKVPTLSRMGGTPSRTAETHIASLPTSVQAAVRPVITVTENVEPEVPQHRYPKVGDQYVSRSGKFIVEIVRVVEDDVSYAVSYRILGNAGLPNAPVTLLADAFHADHRPYTTGTLEPPLPSTTVVDLGDKEEWFSTEHDEYLAILSVDHRKSIVRTRGKTTGRTRVYAVRDFTDRERFQKIRPKSVYERLLDDED
jgi:hypothetical protein